VTAGMATEMLLGWMENPLGEAMQPTLIIIGLNRQSAPLTVCEKYRLSDAQKERAYAELVRSEGVDELIVLVTPNRTEFILWASDFSDAANSVLNFLRREFELSQADWEHFYRLIEEGAFVHLFRLGSGLEAIMPGEENVIGDLRHAWDAAVASNASGRHLDESMKETLTVGQRIWRSTQLTNTMTWAEAEHSASDAALKFCNEVHGTAPEPLLEALKERMTAFCQREMADYGRDFGPLTRAEQSLLEQYTERMVHCLATVISRELNHKGEAEQAELAGALERMFGLAHVLEFEGSHK
jgi:glutamyl-tRNA reductase